MEVIREINPAGRRVMLATRHCMARHGTVRSQVGAIMAHGTAQCLVWCMATSMLIHELAYTCEWNPSATRMAFLGCRGDRDK